MAIQLIVGAALTATGVGAGFAGGLGLTQGTVAYTAASAFGSAAFTSIAQQAIINSAENGLDGLKMTFRGKNLLDIAKSSAQSAALQILPDLIPEELGLTADKVTSLQKFSGELLHDGIAVGLRTAFYGGKFGENFLDYQKESLIDGLAKLGAMEIGALKYGGQLDPFTHKALHAIVGGLTAEFSGSDFASGALGAVIAETIGELYFDVARPKDDDDDPALLQETRDQIKKKEKRLNRKLTLQESIDQSRLVLKELKNAHDGRVVRSKLAGKIAAIGTAFVARQDVGGANKAAVNAVENNLTMMPFVMAGAGVAGAGGVGGAIGADTSNGLAEGELGGTIMGSILWTFDELLDKLTDYVGCEIAALTLLVRIVTDAEFREKFMVKLFEQDKAAGVNECARPGDAPKSRPIITPIPEPRKPLPGFEPVEIEKKPLITPIPNDDDDGVACGGIPIHEPTFEDFILTNEKASGSSDGKDAKSAWDNSSRVRPINGRKPRNHEYAGKEYPLEKLPEELQKKYPHSVPFTGTGHPDFSRYAEKKVKIEMTGIRSVDEKLANEKAGYSKKPDGYTWHHHQDGETMMLVDEKLHAAIHHTGGAAIVKGAKK